MHPQWRCRGSKIEYRIARPRADSGRGGLGCVVHDGTYQSLGKHCESLPAEVRVRPDAGSPVDARYRLMMRAIAALVTGSLVGEYKPPGSPDALTNYSHRAAFERRSVIMLLCPHAIRSQENQGGGHGDRLDGQSCALSNGVQRMQRPIGR